MATKQTDAVAMTEEQLDAVVGGIQEACANGTFFKRRGNMKRRSNRVTDSPTGNDVAIWDAGSTTGIWSDGTFTS